MRAELVNRLAAAGLPRIEAVELRPRRPRPADGGRGGGRRRDRAPPAAPSTPGLVLNERGWERFAASGLDRVNVRSARRRPSTSGTATRRSRRRSHAWRRFSPRPAHAGDSHDFGVLRLPVRRPRRSRRRRRPRRPASPGARRSCLRTRSASRRLAPCGRSSSGRAPRLPRAQHAQHGLRELPRSRRGGRDRARRVGRRPRRLPVRPARHWERRDGGPRLPPRRRGRRDRRRPRRAHRDVEWLETSSAASSRATSIAQVPGRDEVVTKS